MTDANLRRIIEILRQEAEIIRQNNFGSEDWAPGTESDRLLHDEYRELADKLERATVVVMLRPLLVEAMLATSISDQRTYILIDSEQSPDQQNLSLWHEILHLLGMEDEALVEEIAGRLHRASPDALEFILKAQRGK